MSIETVLTDLTKALIGYTDAINVQTKVLEGINQNGVHITRTDAAAPTGAGSVSTPAKQTKAEKKAAEEAAAAAAKGDDNDDDWGDTPAAEAKKITAEDVREAILKVRDKGGEKKNAEEARAIMGKLGVKSPSEIKPEQYEKAIKLCDAALA